MNFNQPISNQDIQNKASTLQVKTLQAELAKESAYYLVDMKYITSLMGVTNKWIYQLIKDGKFPKPIKLGRCSRWKLVDVENWIEAKALETCH